jgi:hypothetical protein
MFIQAEILAFLVMRFEIKRELQNSSLVQKYSSGFSVFLSTDNKNDECIQTFIKFKNATIYEQFIT